MFYAPPYNLKRVSCPFEQRGGYSVSTQYYPIHQSNPLKSITKLIFIYLLWLTVMPLPAQEQDTIGFWPGYDAIVDAPRVEWQQNWLNNQEYNFSFWDNTVFNYGFQLGPPYDARHHGPQGGEITGHCAAFGNLSIGDFLRFALVGYVQEDDIWIDLHAFLSPEYTRMVIEADTSEVDSFKQHFIIENAPWAHFWTFWYRLPEYIYTPRDVWTMHWANHNYRMLARLPVNRTIQVFYGLDAFQSDTELEDDVLRLTRTWWFPPYRYGMPTIYDDFADYWASGHGLWTELGWFTVPDPGPPPEEEPPGWAECRFERWVVPGGASAPDWLPTPGSIVGLVFRFSRDDVPARALVRYNVNHISTWQGQAMNYPVNAPIPVATGTGKHFDYTIPNPDEYDDIDTLDFDVLDNNIPNPINPQAPTRQSIRRLVLYMDLNFSAGTTVIYDTLWLKAQDYAAKAWVSPSTGQTIQDMMDLRETAFGQHVWSVSVPRDDDGQAFYGYNWGDGMADAWEEQMLGLPSESGDSAVVDFVPYYQYVGDTLKYADRDSLPVGRDIKGDGFCNWEEYRGFITVGDQFGMYPVTEGPKHKRLNPFFKNVMVHFMPNAECKPYAPGWMNALPDTMAYLVVYLTQLVDTDSVRLSLQRWVNINKLGTWYPYYSSRPFWNSRFATTNLPADGGYNRFFDSLFQNAVVFWPMYRGGNPDLKPRARDLGFTRGYARQNDPDSSYIPNSVYQTVVLTDSIDAYMQTLQYYQDNPDSLPVDRDKLIRLTIAHESGHIISMEHDIPNIYIMVPYPLEDPGNKHRLVLDPPIFTRQYSPTSISQISIQWSER